MIPGVPYDAEIEYLGSSETQYIDTGITPSTSSKIVIDFRIKGVFQGKFLFGSEVAWGNNALAMVFRTNGSHTVAFGGNHSITDTKVTTGARTLATVSSTGCSLGNVSIAYTGSISGNTYPIYLFGDNRAGSLNARISADIYSCKIYSGTVLVRDFIPVRVGQTGYMYDRVSKRLFGNNGTGSFVLGPDVAKPVMGLYGMRKFTTVKDYVLDGLVAHFDAICNGQNGEHITTGYKWYDLTGNERYLNTWGNQTPRWEDNYVWNYRGFFQNPSVNRDYTENGLTEEYVTYAGWANGGNDVNLGMGLVRNNWLNLSNNAYRFGVFGQYPYTGYSADLIQSTMRKCIAFSVRHDGIGTLYVDGGAITLPMSTSAHPYTKLSGSYNIGVGKNNNGIYQKGVHAYRVYSRALSPAEIAHNYQIDKARFNLS